MSTSHLQPRDAGWYPDPAGGTGLRWHDGQGWTGQTSYAAPVRPLGPGFARLGDWVSRMLALYTALVAGVVVYLGWGVVLARRAARTPGFDLAVNPPQIPLSVRSDAHAFLVTGLWLLLVVSLVYLVTGLLWLVWQHQLAVAAPAPTRRSPGMMVASWFIPFVGYWWPLQNMGDLWRAYGAGRRESAAEASPLVLVLWWAAWVAQPLVGGFGSVVLVTAQQPEQVLTRLLVVYAAQLVVLATAGVLARQLVQRLSWRALVYFAESPRA